jgi:hypothetical protein
MTINVLDFGALGDGSAANARENRTAIQAAIDAAQAAGGGFVFMPPGIYCIDGTLNIKGNSIRLGGDSNGTRVRMVRPDQDIIHIGSDGFQVSEGVAQCVVEYLVLDASLVMDRGTYAVRLRNGHSIVLQNLRIDGYGGLRNGLLLQGGNAMYNYRVMNCEINEMEENGVVIDKGTTDVAISQPQGVWIDNSEIAGGNRSQRGIWAKHVTGLYISNSETLNGKSGLVLEPGDGETVRYVLINNFLSDTCSEDQFYAAPGVGTDGTLFDIQISNSWFASSTAGHGVNVRGITGLQLNGCKIVNNARHGIQLFQDNRDVIVNASIIAANNQSAGHDHGIYVGQTNRKTIITSNVIGLSHVYRSNRQLFGIFLDTTDDFIVSNNILTGNVNGGISNNQGTGTSRIIDKNVV